MNGTVPNRGDTKVSEVVNGKERPPATSGSRGVFNSSGTTNDNARSARLWKSHPFK